MTNIEVVLNTLKHQTEPMSAGQIAEKTGMNKKDVDKAMKSLKDEGIIFSPRRCYWTVK